MRAKLNNTTAMRQVEKRYRRRALTLIEMAVGLACLGILLPILIAATGSAARPNREQMCAYRLGQLGSAMQLYVAENEGWLPGSPGTSGAPLILEYGDLDGDDVNIPIAPTQTWDWAAPLATYLNVPLDPNRSKRVAQFRTGKFWCPSNNVPSYPYHQGSIGPFNDWPRLRMLSYNSIRNFLMFADDAPLNSELGVLPKWSANVGGTIEIPSQYTPRIDNVGNVAEKVFLADGSRFTDDYSGLVDHPIDFLAKSGGMYSDAGASYPEQYLRSYFFDLPEKAYSYRHPRDADYGINVTYFDGHVAWMSEDTSRHPRWWYPTGTTIPVSEMNHAALLLVWEEIMNDPLFLYHVP